MIRRRWFALGLALLPVAIPTLSWLAWMVRPVHRTGIAIFDKTAGDSLQQEHRSLIWSLRHERIGFPDGQLPDPSRDYYGFHPRSPRSERGYSIRDLERMSAAKLDSFADGLDLVYYTDAYGVYRDEWYPDSIADSRSPLLYGGMTAKELRVLERVRDRGKLVICEFNTIASPTSWEIRTTFEHSFDMSWTGWMLRHFESLDTASNGEIPRWLVQAQLRQTNSWPFRRSGIVFVHEDGRVRILEDSVSLDDPVPWIVPTPSLRRIADVSDSVPYPFWIDVIKPGFSMEPMAWYHVRTNAHGDSLLAREGIPSNFPAVLRSQAPRKFWYFAGDHADNPVGLASSSFAWIHHVGFLFHSRSPSDRARFFWEFHRPLLKSILAGIRAGG